MKKFLVFLVSIVTVVCVGLITFYFMKNDEVISFETKEIYVNAGDTITLEELGFSRKKASKKTTFDYNAGGDEVTSAVRFDDKLGYYIVDGTTAGDIKLVISTSNKKYAEFVITVHVGNGTIDTPYYIFNETDLSKIGSVYGLNDHYQLMSNITLSSSFAPIGFSEMDQRYVGFSGSFNGNFHTISQLNLVDGEYVNAGLFSSINAGASVSNLTVVNSTISGEYTTAGILAGTIAGNIDRIAVVNSTITNKANSSKTGALAGFINGNAKLVYADNVAINIGTDVSVSNVVVGGLFGEINQATVQASYVNNSTINTFAGSTGKFGGFAGNFVINTNKGSIQQSYANVTSEEVNFAAFLGEIEKIAGFAATGNDVIKFLIGNAVVTNGKDMVKNYDSTYFTTFKNIATSTYLISDYATAGEMQSQADSNGIIFYAINSQDIKYWDTEYVWETSNSSLPKLVMGKVNPEIPVGEYFRKDLDVNEVGSATKTFAETFNSDKQNMSYLLLNDEEITTSNPVALTNVTLDGNNRTITVNLNNANGENLGLFSVLDNCTIKNLNIVVTGVSANATNVGALAGKIISSDENSNSSIENVNVIFSSVSNITATNFGGIVGVAEKTNITKSNADIVASANITNFGGLVATLSNDSLINNCSVNATIAGTQKVGGLVAVNNGTVSNILNSTIALTSSNASANAYFGGLVAENNGSILDVTSSVSIQLNSANTNIYAGGVVAVNKNAIQNVKVSGDGIFATELTANVYIGGVVATNQGTILSVQNNLITIGANYTGKNFKVGGVAYNNIGQIEKIVVNSQVLGNYAAGVVAEMNSSSAKIDQVAINNTIKGDKYVAGIVVDFKAGNITNIQAASEIVGLTNTTRSSLIALIFPYGANLKQATISSSLNGYGTFYRETWTDFAAYSNKAEFGFSNGETGDARFNLYANDTHHGSMQDVVIDSFKTGVNNAKAAMGGAFAWGKDYTDSSESSYIKVVNGFNNASQFSGSFEFVCATSSWLGIKHKETRTLNFAMGRTWRDNGNGISLIFLDSLN